MKQPPRDSAVSPIIARVQTVSSGQSRWMIAWLNLSLTGLMAASLWQLLGPEPESTWIHRLQLAAVALGTIMSVAIWIATARWTLPIKSFAIGCSLFVAVFTAMISDRDFQASNRVLEPARFQQGRVVHAGLGLSYAAPPGFRFNLQPLITQNTGPSPYGSRLSPHRLRFGEMAILSRLAQDRQTVANGRTPASIILEVQRARTPDLNALILDVRRQEAKWSEFESIQIVKHTHCLTIGGIEFVEFDFLERPQRLLSRQVFLRTRTLVLNLMLNSEAKSDGAVFDQFLESIRFDGAN